jgi:DNA-binding response OmpR family regulator
MQEVQPSELRRVLISHVGRPGGGWVDEITGFLTPRSVRVERSYTAPQTVGLIERGGIDVAILSDDLPEVRGLRLLDVVRSIDAQLPCVMVVRGSSQHSLHRALELQAYSVLNQPVSIASLRRVLTGLFRSRFDRVL